MCISLIMRHWQCPCELKPLATRQGLVSMPPPPRELINRWQKALTPGAAGLPARCSASPSLCITSEQLTVSCRYVASETPNWIQFIIQQERRHFFFFNYFWPYWLRFYSSPHAINFRFLKAYTFKNVQTIQNGSERKGELRQQSFRLIGQKW